MKGSLVSWESFRMSSTEICQVNKSLVFILAVQSEKGHPFTRRTVIFVVSLCRHTAHLSSHPSSELILFLSIKKQFCSSIIIARTWIRIKQYVRLNTVFKTVVNSYEACSCYEQSFFKIDTPTPEALVIA